MNLKRKHFVKLLAMMMALLMFAACAKESKLPVSNDPNLGLWQATLVESFGEEFAADEIFEIGFDIELLPGGKCNIFTDGEKNAFDWSIKDDILSISQKKNTFITAMIKGPMMVIEDYMSTGMKITLYKEGSVPETVLPVDTEPDDPDPGITEPDPGELEATVQTVWNGDWYGYFWMTEYYGFWQPEDDTEDEMFDALMTIEVDEEGQGRLSIRLKDAEEDIVETTVRGDEYLLETVDGYFLDADLEAGDWWLGISPIDEGNLVVIADTYFDPDTDGEDGFEYMFVFRPWGELWEEEERESKKLPPGYEEYKADLAEAPDPSIYEPVTGDEPGGDDDWVGTVVDFTTNELKDIYNLLKSAYDKGELRGMSYREICETYFEGSAGELDLDGETVSFYVWRASDNSSNYVQVTFQDYEGDGNRTAGGIGYSFE